MDTQNKKVWFVTGASKGLGLALVTKLLDQGYQVAATSRSISNFPETFSQNINFLPLEVDLTNPESIEESIQNATVKFGKLDVIVNNAGYGIGGAIEELSDKEIREPFEINVFATINVIKSVMPQLRKQQSGHIINIASIAGFNAAIGWAIYAATKFAVVGLSEVLAEDVKEFGIKVTVVEPGGFRTKFLSSESLALPENPIPDYTGIRASHAKYATIDGKQTGDPEKAADVFIQLGENPNPPIRLFMGSDSYRRASEKVATLKEDLENGKAISESTDATT